MADKMNELSSKKNIMRSLIFGVLILVFSKTYFELLPVSNLFYALEISPSKNANSTLAIYVIYMALWVSLLILAKKVSCKIIPSDGEVDSQKEENPKFKPQLKHWVVLGFIILLAVVFPAFLSFSNLTTNQTIIFSIISLFIFSIITVFIKLIFSEKGDK